MSKATFLFSMFCAVLAFPGLLGAASWIPFTACVAIAICSGVHAFAPEMPAAEATRAALERTETALGELGQLTKR